MQQKQISQVRQVEPMRDFVIDLKPISAIFLKFPVAGRKPPLLAVFQNMIEPIATLKAQNDEPETKLADIQVYYSYTNPFPCSGTDEENDGSFTSTKEMTIGVHGDSCFSHSFIYMAIYARTTTFKDRLVYAFGDQASKMIEQRSRSKNESSGQASQTPRAA